MKKILSILSCSLLLLSLLTFGVGAKGKGASFSEDYGKFYYNNNSYTAVNSGILYDYQSTEYDVDIPLTAAQKQKLSYLEIDISDNESVISANFGFINGGNLSYTYLNDKYSAAYTSAIKGEGKNLFIYFTYNDNYFTDLSRLKSKKTTISYDGRYHDICSVIESLDKENLGIHCGEIVKVEEKFYYIDYFDAGIDYTKNDPYADKKEPITAYELTDEKLIERVEKEYSDYYGDQFGYIDDKDVANVVSIALLTILFGIVPLAILILFLIFTLRSKTKYKKLYFIISLLSGTELLVFALLCALMF